MSETDEDARPSAAGAKRSAVNQTFLLQPADGVVKKAKLVDYATLPKNEWGNLVEKLNIKNLKLWQNFKIYSNNPEVVCCTLCCANILF